MRLLVLALLPLLAACTPESRIARDSAKRVEIELAGEITGTERSSTSHASIPPGLVTRWMSMARAGKARRRSSRKERTPHPNPPPQGGREKERPPPP